jgi:hypothetical protein
MMCCSPSPVIACLRVVGFVLVNALLVIPAATANLLTRSLGQLFALAPVLGIGSGLAGLMLSSGVDAPSGPAIIVLAGSCFSSRGDAPPGGLGVTRGEPERDGRCLPSGIAGKGSTSAFGSRR